MSKEIFVKRRSHVEKVIGRLIESANKPAAVRQGTDGAACTWGMSLQDEFDFRALTAWCEVDLNWSDAAIILSRMVAKSMHSVTNFEDLHFELRSEVAKQESRAPEWRYYIPIHAEAASGLSLPVTIQVLGLGFELQNWEVILEQFDAETLRNMLARVRHRRALPAPKLGLIAKAKGRNSRAAWEKIAKPFDTFRGEIEFIFGSLRSHLSSPPTCARVFPHPPWMAIIDPIRGSADYANFDINEADKECPRKTITFDEGLVNSLAGFVTASEPRSPQDTRALAAEALALYAQAMDSHDVHAVMLALWQMAESITLAGRHNGNGKVVATRLAQLLKRQVELDHHATKDVLYGFFFHRRNLIVHKGLQTEVDQSDANVFRWSCELALQWIMEHVDELPTTSHLEEFYALAGAHPNRLNVVEAAVHMAKRVERPCFHPRGS